MKKKKGLTVTTKQRIAGWAFLTPASLLIFILSFYPMFQALLTSFKTGSSANMKWAPLFFNYKRMFADKLFMRSVGNTFLYLIIQVPIMLIVAILLAQILNNKDLKFKGLFRTMVFLPCATSLVSYALIFKSLFATQGLMNQILQNLGITHENINFLGTPITAKAIIIIALLWRWTGYNMVFYLAGLQNIEYQVYEAAKIDGANGWQTFWRITWPLSLPGVISGITMVFVPSLTTFVISDILGGGKILLIGNIIEQLFTQDNDRNAGAGLSIVMMIFIVISTLITEKYDKEGEVK